MDEVLIRECTVRDLDAVLELDNRWYQENIAHDFVFSTLSSLAAELERFPHFFLVAEWQGRLVGYINGAARANHDVPVLADQESYLEIENLYVLPEWRNQNLGGRLIDRLIEIGERHGLLRQIVSTDNKDTDRILAFYRNHGFAAYFIRLFR